MAKCNLKNRTNTWLINRNIIEKTNKVYRGNPKSLEKNKLGKFYELKSNYLKEVEKIRKEKGIPLTNTQYAENLLNSEVINLFKKRYGIKIPEYLLRHENRPIRIKKFKPHLENNIITSKKVNLDKTFFDGIGVFEDLLLYNVNLMKDSNGELLSSKYNQEEWNKLTVPQRQKVLNGQTIKPDVLYQKINKKNKDTVPPFEKMTKEDQVAFEKTIRDLAARLSYRIGIEHEIINNPYKKWKGNIRKNKAYINLAYATLDTPIHEILGHPIIRSIKNNNKVLYNKLLKELEYGKGKEVFDRIKRTYVYKDFKTFETTIIKDDNVYPTEEYQSILDYAKKEGFYSEDPFGKSNFTENKEFELNGFKYKVTDKGILKAEKHTLEEQQEEALVELTGLYTSKKIEKNTNLWKLLKQVLKDIKENLKALYKGREIEINKLPNDMTLKDLANLLAYRDSHIILPSHKVVYTTPDNEKFETYPEANNHLDELDKLDEIDLNKIKIQKNRINNINDITVNEFKIRDYNKFPSKYVKIDNKWYQEYKDSPEFPGDDGITHKLIPDEKIISLFNFFKENKKSKISSIIKKFLKIDKEYQQSKMIVDEYMKVNDIHYDPEEVYSRGQGFYSVLGAYSDVDVNLLLQNLLIHINHNKISGDEFAISAFTKKVDERLYALEEDGGKIRFKIFPKANHIKWASNIDVVSGSVWDSPEIINKNKKSEILGVSYTKSPNLERIFSVQPNLAYIIDKINHHHNELAIELTYDNFRLEYDDDIPYSTKKIVNTINSILDKKYGKLVEPKIIKNHSQKITKDDFENAKFKGEIIESAKSGYGKSEVIKYKGELYHKFDPIIDEITYYKDISKQPTKTINNIKESMDSIYKRKFEDFKKENPEYIDKVKVNLKVSALKYGKQKFPRSLIRSEVVKIKNTETEEENSFEDFQKIQNENNETYIPVEKAVVEMFNEEEQKSEKAKKFVNELVEKLTNNLGLDEGIAEFIDEKTAEMITADSENKYEGQAAFFYKGKIYFVEGNYNYETAIHEFSHIFVKSIKKDNKKLFDKLFNDIINTEVGKIFYQESKNEYKDVENNEEQVKEETLVKMITYLRNNKNAIKHKNIFDRILFLIKSLLRKVFKVNPKNISLNTSIEELSKMIVDNKWKVNMDTISQDEIVSYLSEYKDRFNSMKEAFNSGKGRMAIHHQLVLNSQTVRNQLNLLEKSDSEEEIKEVLSDFSGDFIYDKMSQNIGDKLSTRKQINEAANNKINDLKVFERKIEALAFNLELLDNTLTNIDNQIINLIDEPNQKEALRQSTFFQNSLEQWHIYLKEFKANLEEGDIGLASDIYKDVSDLQNKVESTLNKLNKVYEKAVSSALTEVYEPIKSKIIDNFKKEIEKSKKNLEKATPGSKHYKVIEKTIKDLEDLIEDVDMTKNKMVEYLTGKKGDIGQLHAYFESFLNIQDPSIASFASFLKDNLMEVSTNVQNKYSEFMNEIAPLFKSLGLNPSNLKEMGKNFLFTDTGYDYDKDGNVIESKVLTFLNEYRNYNYTLKKLNFELKKASNDLIIDNSQENKEKLEHIQKVKDKHIKLFFKKQHVPEFYDAIEILDKSPYAEEIKKELETILSNINSYQNSHPDSSEIYDDYEIVEQLWKEYKQMFSLTDKFGELKTGKDLEKAEILREWKEAKNKFYEFNTNTLAFEAAYKNFIEKLEGKLDNSKLEKDSKEYKEEFERQVKEWERLNTTIKIKNEYYEEKANLINEIKDILGEDTTLDEEYESLIELLKTEKDEDGVPVGNEMEESKLSKILEFDKKIEDYKDKKRNKNNLTKEESQKLNDLKRKLINGEVLSKEEYHLKKKLETKSKGNSNLTKVKKSKLKILLNKLNDLQETKFTNYYYDVLNEHYRRIQIKNGVEDGKIKVINSNNINFILEVNNISVLLKDEQFKKWFENNHFIKKVFNKTNFNYDKIWSPSSAWSMKVPKNEKYYEKSDIFDESGNLIRTIKGVPNIKYKIRKVKDEFHQGYDKKTGKINDSLWKDNRNNQLPKSLEEMQKIDLDELNEHNEDLEKMFGHKFSYDHYINREYLKLKKENNDRFKLLEKIKELHFEAQEGLDEHARLGNELARFRKTTDQYILNTSVNEDNSSYGGRVFKGALAKIKKMKDDFEEIGSNYDPETLFIDIDMFASDNIKIPIRGKYRIEENQVSLDILNSTFAYYQSAQKNKQLSKIQPLATAMQKLAETNPVDKNNKKVNIYNKRDIPGKNNNRKLVIDGMIEMLIEGKKLNNNSNNNAYLIRFVNLISKTAAHTYFALDVTSAMKNYLGARWEVSREGFRSKHYSYKDYVLGRPWALKAMSKWSSEIYKKEAKSLESQILLAFQAVQGIENKIGESPGRNLKRDALNFKWLTSHRKWLELEVTVELFSALMRSNQIEHNGKLINYIDAWELDKSGKLKLKEGIDKKYDLNGSEFNRIKKLNHELSNKKQGAYAEMDQPIISRFLAFRPMIALKKYFTRMALDRFGFRKFRWDSGIRFDPRINTAEQQAEMGWYIRNLMTLSKIAETRGKYALTLTNEEKQSLRLGILGYIRLQLYGILLSYLWALTNGAWGYDGDDEDVIGKLKARSGAMPSLWTSEEATENFNIPGWFSNELTLISLEAESEYKTFIPLPGEGLNSMFNTLFGDISITIGGSLKLFKNLFSSMYFTATDNNLVYYKKKAGDMKFQQGDQNRFWIDFWRLLSVKEKTFQPVTGIKQIRSRETGYRR